MGYFEKIYQSDLSHRARAVYMYPRDHADGEGKCWPGIRTIAAELRLSRSTVKRALDDLCRAELISRDNLAAFDNHTVYAIITVVTALPPAGKFNMEKERHGRNTAAIL